MSVNISSAEQDYFDAYVRSGVSVEEARRFAREDAYDEAHPTTNQTDGRS